MTRPAMIDLHELVRLPVGEAERRLRAAGLWDDEARGPRPVRQYRVTVTAEFNAQRVYEVSAPDADVARKLAMGLGEQDLKHGFIAWDETGSHIEDCREVREIPQ